MRTIRLLLLFYQFYAYISLSLSLICAYILYTNGAGIFAIVFWFKIFTLTTIVYFVHHYKRKTYPYFKNLGLPPRRLWVSTLTFDFVVFLVLVILTLQLR
ncbi:MAG: hypothetical protein ACFB10_03280 [Salibacteraceae bacterium]